MRKTRKRLLPKMFNPKLKLLKGTRFVSFAFIFTAFLIAAGVILGANRLQEEVQAIPFQQVRS